jgi:hypothetical protein
MNIASGFVDESLSRLTLVICRPGCGLLWAFTG